ncbi:L,D-transpeptidase [bacterium]|nr:L,D-transpeptidase [bacterium]
MSKLRISNVFVMLCALLVALSAVAKAAPAEESAQAEGSAPYYTRAQKLISELVAEGETDLDELVAVIANDSNDTLDHLIVNVATQRIYECNAAGQVLNESKVSSGRKGYDTPLGTYEIQNRAPKAYSQKYDAWMLHWMGLTADGSYGMHGLEGSSYERLLGGVASHGCVRLSRKYAKELYSRIKVGMQVKIISDKEFSLPKYEPLSKEAATNIVLDVLSPQDPEQVFF